MRTKERILQTSLDLFNRQGVGVVTTNHIAKAMGISPGNLYFHFRNKEEIIFDLFEKMCRETYEIWRPRRLKLRTPMQFIDDNFELYWRYRFFHREMYALRRKDSKLHLEWRRHIRKMITLMEILYRRWVKEGRMVQISDKQEMLYVSESLLVMATSFLQVFESAERSPTRKSIERGKRHV
ncbi:MAG: TetR/AcrR family transcriptional regulator, partial [Bdellovibrionaceae bacterium]|nr:TetR/AcrR family transcriptional regulator [Pseudobdellovibrionaceae bacterium]